MQVLDLVTLDTNMFDKDTYSFNSLKDLIPKGNNLSSFEINSIICSNAFLSGLSFSILTFKNKEDMDLSIPVKDKIYKSKQYSILLSGNCVIDILHRNNIIDISSLLLELFKLNPKLKVDTNQSYVVDVGNNRIIKPDMNYLKEKYIKGRE